MRITTWNMQGSSASTEVKWQTGVAPLLQSADVVCLQESGGVPGSAVHLNDVSFKDPAGNMEVVSLYAWGGTESRPRYGIAFHHWDVGGNRVNEAIVAPIGAGGACTLIWPAYLPVWRPALGLNVNGGWILSFHAISGGGADAANMVAAIASSLAGSAWCAGADFNREPGSFAVPAGCVVCPPNTFTYSVMNPRARYDYFVRSGGGPAQTGTVLGLNLSDHYPAAFAF
jgi:cytolethal distending toxin subunit B